MSAKEERTEKVPLLRLKVPLDGEPAEDLDLMVYAFDRAGAFLANAPVVRDQAKLAIDPKQAGRARLYVGPPPPEEIGDEAPTLKLMKRIRAYQPVWRFDPQQPVQELLPIPRAVWELWPFCLCRVRGQVVRPVSVGGTEVDLPVCNARVHICEVDRIPWLILRLPDDLLFRLRRDLLRELLRRIPRPLPDPPVWIDPGYIDPSPENMALREEMRQFRGEALLGPQPEPPDLLQNPIALNPQPEVPSDFRMQQLSSRLEAVAFNPQPEPPGSAPFYTLSADLQARLTSNSPKVVREALVANLDLLRPYLCLWPWFWGRLRCDEVRVVETDSQGRFDTLIWYLCGGDHPDLYFWVEYQIEGVWTTVYEPPMACNTYWNYECGSEVTIRVTDSRVPGCGHPDDPAGAVVVVMGIGKNVSVGEIEPPGTAGVSPPATAGLTTGGAPFGGVLEPRVLFGRNGLFAAGIEYYRWSYRRLTDGDENDVSDGWHFLDKPVVRHYMVIEITPGDVTVSFPVDPMGPVAVGGEPDLFRIQPLDPPSPGESWVVIDEHQDLASAFFETHKLEDGNAAAAAGKYELKLELFDTSGNRVNLDGMLRVPIGEAPFGPEPVETEVPPADNQLVESGHVVAFRMVVHVDNNICHGHIHDAQLGGVGAGTCGFLEYQNTSQDLNISFLASHPHDFATFNFRVVRGSAGDVPSACASGRVGMNHNGFTEAGGVYSKDVAVSTLLTEPVTEPPCTHAAYAQRLDVYAMATNGWTRLSYLDAPRTGLGEQGLKAFALAPAPPAVSTD